MLSIILLNILAYSFILVTLFMILFFFKSDQFSVFSDFRKLNILTFTNVTFICCILALAGTPPLLGFTTKLLAILILLKYKYYIYILFFFFLNTFSIYFYITFLRFLRNTALEKTALGAIVNSSLNTTVIYNSVVFSFVIFVNILFSMDFIRYMLYTFI